jgi:hypothetical protein
MQLVKDERNNLAPDVRAGLLKPQEELGLAKNFQLAAL